jgi:hypothetical protein
MISGKLDVPGYDGCIILMQSDIILTADWTRELRVSSRWMGGAGGIRHLLPYNRTLFYIPTSVFIVINSSLICPSIVGHG